MSIPTAAQARAATEAALTAIIQAECEAFEELLPRLIKTACDDGLSEAFVQVSSDTGDDDRLCDAVEITLLGLGYTVDSSRGGLKVEW